MSRWGWVGGSTSPLNRVVRYSDGLTPPPAPPRIQGGETEKTAFAPLPACVGEGLGVRGEPPSLLLKYRKPSINTGQALNPLSGRRGAGGEAPNWNRSVHVHTLISKRLVVTKQGVTTLLVVLIAVQGDRRNFDGIRA